MDVADCGLGFRFSATARIYAAKWQLDHLPADVVGLI
jgi:hypothetical protein